MAFKIPHGSKENYKINPMTDSDLVTDEVYKIIPDLLIVLPFLVVMGYIVSLGADNGQIIKLSSYEIANTIETALSVSGDFDLQLAFDTPRDIKIEKNQITVSQKKASYTTDILAGNYVLPELTQKNAIVFIISKRKNELFFLSQTNDTNPAKLPKVCTEVNKIPIQIEAAKDIKYHFVNFYKATNPPLHVVTVFHTNQEKDASKKNQPTEPTITIIASEDLANYACILYEELLDEYPVQYILDSKKTKSMDIFIDGQIDSYVPIKKVMGEIFQ